VALKRRAKRILSTTANHYECT